MIGSWIRFLLGRHQPGSHRLPRADSADKKLHGRAARENAWYEKFVSSTPVRNTREPEPFPTIPDIPVIRDYPSRSPRGVRPHFLGAPVPDTRLCAGRAIPNHGELPAWVQDELGAATTAQAVANICCW